jgi:hypothetical protein
MPGPVGCHPTNGRCSAPFGRGAGRVRALFHRGFMPLPLGGTALHLLKSPRAAMRRGAGPCIGGQKNLRPLKLARHMPGSAEKCPVRPRDFGFIKVTPAIKWQIQQVARETRSLRDVRRRAADRHQGARRSGRAALPVISVVVGKRAAAGASKVCRQSSSRPPTPSTGSRPKRAS